MSPTNLTNLINIIWRDLLNTWSEALSIVQDYEINFRLIYVVKINPNKLCYKIQINQKFLGPATPETHNRNLIGIIKSTEQTKMPKAAPV